MAVRKILLPVDGSPGAGAAARFAAELARSLDASLTLIYVFDAPAAASLGMVAKGNLDETKEQVSRGSFEAAREAIGDVLQEVGTHVDIGHPAQAIVGYAKAGSFDMIVMGTRGLSPLKELVIGSVSDRVLRLASCPVTLVRGGH